MNIKKFSCEYKKIFLTFFFSFRVYYKMVELTREENDIIAEHQELINTLNRYDSTRKVKELSKIGL